MAERRRWHSLGEGVYELGTAAITCLVRPDTPREGQAEPAYVVDLVVGGERFTQSTRYEGAQGLLLARIAAVAQAQAVITRAGAQLRCAAVDLNRELLGKEGTDDGTQEADEDAG